MGKTIHRRTEQLALQMARALFGWQEAAKKEDLASCQQFETEIFESVETNGLSQEWLELYAALTASRKETNEARDA